MNPFLLKLKQLEDNKDIHNMNDNTGNDNTGNDNTGYRNSGDYNTGNDNTGNDNTGYCNTGYCNSGDYNSGNRNSGNRNSGSCNSGDYNSGNRNSGDRNSGSCNSGNYNTGNYNSGSHNTGDYNSGFFNTESCLGYLFNKPTIITPEIRTKLHLLSVRPRLSWVYSSDMTSEEKEKNPSYKTTGGFLRDLRKTDYSTLTQDDKNFIKSLPNYDDEIFFQITGMRLLEPKKN